MWPQKFKLQMFLYVICIAMSLVSCSALKVGRTGESGRYKRGSQIGLLPNSIEAAKDNANMVAKYVNNGYGIIVDNRYFIGKSDIPIERDFRLKGSPKGQLVMTTRLSWTITRPIHILLSELSIASNTDSSPSSQIRLIENSGCNYHSSVIIESCRIDGVRVYSHIASDVDQVLIKDGVKSFVFKNNVVTNTGFYVVRLTNCLCEEVSILYNEITGFKSIVFGLNVTNGIRDIGFPRIKKVYFSGNKINNASFVLDDSYDYEYIYHTPITVESEYAECKDNVIENILCTQERPIAVYPGYLSSTTVVILGNKITNCLNLSNSSNNEIFKCKQALNGPAVRLIENNVCVITKDCLRKCKNKKMPYVKMYGFQTDRIKSAIIRNNTINVACDFVFGAPMKSEYEYFEFSNNSVSYNDLGGTSRQLLRLLPSASGKGIIKINKNTVKSIVPPSTLYALYDYDYSGYSIEVNDNCLIGSLPYGSVSGALYTPVSVSCQNNTIDIGEYNSLIKIPTYVKANDVIAGGRPGYSIRLIGKPQLAKRLIFDFPSCPPASVSFQDASNETAKVRISSSEDADLNNQRVGKLNSGKYMPSKKTKRIHIELEK